MKLTPRSCFRKVSLCAGIAVLATAVATAGTVADDIVLTDTLVVSNGTTYTGILSGPGSILVTDGATCQLKNQNNSFSGGIVITNGTVSSDTANGKSYAYWGAGDIWLYPNGTDVCKFYFASDCLNAIHISGTSTLENTVIDNWGGAGLYGPVYVEPGSVLAISDSGYATRVDYDWDVSKIYNGKNGIIYAKGSKIIGSLYSCFQARVAVKTDLLELSYATGGKYPEGRKGGFALQSPDNSIDHIRIDYNVIRCSKAPNVMTNTLFEQYGQHFGSSNGCLSLTYDQSVRALLSDEAPRTEEFGYGLRNDGATARTLTITGEANTNYTTYGKLDGLLSLKLAAPATFRQTFMNRRHENTGTVTVSGGTLELGGDTTFENVTAVTLTGGVLHNANPTLAAFAGVRALDIRKGASYTTAAGTPWAFAEEMDAITLGKGVTLDIPEGTSVRVRALTVDGTRVPFGTYAGGSEYRPAALTGGGEVIVTESVPGEGEPTVWTAGGGEDESVFNAANWEEDITGRLAFDSVLGVFASAGTRATVSGSPVFKGLKLDLTGGQGAFTLAPAAEDAKIRLGGGGITNGSDAAILSCVAADVTQMLNIETPVELVGDQAWHMRTNLGLRVVGGLSGSRKVAVDGGYLELADAADYEGALSIANNEALIHGTIGKADGAGSLTLKLNENDKTYAKGFNFGYVLFSNAVVNLPLTINHGGGGMSNYSTMLRYTAPTAPVTNVFNKLVTAQNSTTFYLGGNSTAILNGGLTGGNNVIFRNAAASAGKPATFVFNGPVTARGNATKSYITTETAGTVLVFNTSNNVSQVGLRGSLGGIFRFGTDDAFSDTCFYMSTATQTATLELGSTRQNFTYFSGYAGTTVKGEAGSAIRVTWGIEDSKPDEIASKCTFTKGTIQGDVDWEVALAAANRVFRFDDIKSASTGDISVSNGLLEFTSTASWRNGTNVTVSGEGKLKVGAGGTFGKHAVLRFSENGTFEMPADGLQKVAACFVDGAPVSSGIYAAADLKDGDPLYGHLTGGVLRVGKVGGVLIVR